MASTYTSNNGIEKPAPGDQEGEWGATLNTNFDIIDRVLSGVGSISLSGTTHTLTTTDGTLTDGMYKVLILGGSPSGTNTITISPNDQDKLYFVVNSSGQTATFTQGTGSNVSIATGAFNIIYADGAGDGAAVTSLLANDVVFGDDVSLQSDGAVLNFGADDDTKLTHTDGTGLTLNSTNKLTFGDAASFVQQSSDGVLKIDGEATIDMNASTAVTVSNDLKLDSDDSVLGFGVNNDVTLTHVHDTGLLLNSTMQLQFNDASQNITAPSATVLDINATDEVEINATELEFNGTTADINANLDVSGTYQGGGTMTTGGNIVIPDAGNIGSASDTDAVAISSGGVVSFSQVPTFPDDTIETADIQDNAVTLAKMAGLVRGKIIYGDSSGDPAALAVGSANTVLKSDGTDVAWASVATAFIADNAVTLAKMAGLARGKIIYGDASGDPAALAVGSANHVLKSDGTDIAWAANTATVALDDIGTGDAASTLATSAGNITIDAQATDADVIIKVDDAGASVTAVTFDGSEAGKATFNSTVTSGAGLVIADAGNIGSASDTDAMAIASTGQVTFSQNINPPYPARNYLINGDFAVSQRLDGATATSATTPANNDDTYIHDRWLLLSDGNDIVDVGRATANRTDMQYFNWTQVETADKKFGYAQIVENKNAAQLVGGSAVVTLSFVAAVNNTARLDDIRAGIVSWSSTADAVTSDLVSAWNAADTNPTLATNWTFENTPANLSVTTSFVRYSVTATIDTGSTANVAAFIWSNSLDNDVDDILYLGACQLELGSQPTPFITEDYEENLARCQRYYNRIPVGTGSAKYSYLIAASTAGGSYLRNETNYPVTMRSTTQTNTQTGAGTSGTLSGVAPGHSTENYVAWQMNVTAVGNYSYFSNGILTNDCEL